MNVSYSPTTRSGLPSAIRAATDPRGDRFEFADNGESRVLGDAAAWSESFLQREFEGVLTGGFR